MLDENQLARERAAVLLDVWGTGNDPEPCGRYAFTIEGAPEWSEQASLEGAITALDLSGPYGTPKPIDGYAIVATYTVGECQCPWCEGTGQRPEFEDGEETARVACELCEGDCYLSAGDDLQVVMVPRYRLTEDGEELADGVWDDTRCQNLTGREGLAALLWGHRADGCTIRQAGPHAWDCDGTVFALVDRADPDTGWLRSDAKE